MVWCDDHDRIIYISEDTRSDNLRLGKPVKLLVHKLNSSFPKKAVQARLIIYTINLDNSYSPMNITTLFDERIDILHEDVNYTYVIPPDLVRTDISTYPDWMGGVTSPYPYDPTLIKLWLKDNMFERDFDSIYNRAIIAPRFCYVNVEPSIFHGCRYFEVENEYRSGGGGNGIEIIGYFELTHNRILELHVTGTSINNRTPFRAVNDKSTYSIFNAVKDSITITKG